ncbi:mast cell protease 1-like [Mauremys reevesii]|uniref:mast cell protease 1-like n=1 Tax=Mauremys reevesii TaxID=260615 RepID=UPI00193F7CBB|nr:mast cell protease 1-like [Mauremys reevesii]
MQAVEISRGSNIFVYLGVQDFMKPGQNWQRIRAHRWVQHPDFNNEYFHNDIMLLKGDSGGPLVCEGLIQGIISNGDVDRRPPSIYMRISKFIPWINETLQKLN